MRLLVNNQQLAPPLALATSRNRLPTSSGQPHPEVPRKATGELGRSEAQEGVLGNAQQRHVIDANGMCGKASGFSIVGGGGGDGVGGIGGDRIEIAPSVVQWEAEFC